MSKKTERARERQAAAVKGGVHPVEAGPKLVEMMEARCRVLAGELVGLEETAGKKAGVTIKVRQELIGVSFGVACVKHPYRVLEEGSLIGRKVAARFKKEAQDAVRGDDEGRLDERDDGG